MYMTFKENLAAFGFYLGIKLAFICKIMDWRWKLAHRLINTDAPWYWEAVNAELAKERGKREMAERALCMTELKMLRCEAQRADEQKKNMALRSAAADSADAICSLIRLNTDALKSKEQFLAVCENDRKEWEVITAYCSLGGCEMGGPTFTNERDAYLCAAILHAIGFKAESGVTCSSCCAEFQKECY